MSKAYIDIQPSVDVLKANQGITLQTIADALEMTYLKARVRIRKARMEKAIICLGRNNRSRWYTMDYYIANKEALDLKHKPTYQVKPSKDQHAFKLTEYDHNRDWVSRVARFDQLMLRPS